MSYYLTKKLADEAIDIATPTILQSMKRGFVKRFDLHIVISVMDPDGRWKTLTERSFGNPDNWEYHYDDVARNKDNISRRTGMPTRYVHEVHPELLEPGDTVYWGNAMMDNVIVSCSGVQEWGDEMFSFIILDLCKGQIQRVLELLRAEGGETLK
jgi:hypothetical protein